MEMKTIKNKAAKPSWKSAVMILSTALCVGAMAPRAFAQGVPANRDINWGEVSAFDAYLDQHPIMAQQLSANPGLVRNEEYLERHPDLRNFLNRNSDVRDEITETPGWFMQREAEYRQIEGANGGINRVELDNLDRYLDTHPDVARELSTRPGLADNREYLEQHPELRVFLVRHPGVWAQFQAHPKWLMFREQRFQSKESSDTDYRHREVDHRDRDADYRHREMNYGDTRDRAGYWNAHPELSRQIHANPAPMNSPATLVRGQEPREVRPAHTEAVAEATPGQSRLHRGLSDRHDDGQHH